jgi:hypothetical protein
MPRGNPGVRRQRPKCSICKAVGVRAPTCTGDRESHQAMAVKKVEIDFNTRALPQRTPEESRQYRGSTSWVEIEEDWGSIRVDDRPTPTEVVRESHTVTVESDPKVEILDEMNHNLDRIATALESLARRLGMD